MLKFLGGYLTGTTLALQFLPFDSVAYNTLVLVSVPAYIAAIIAVVKVAR
jgi:hypothetical protein